MAGRQSLREAQKQFTRQRLLDAAVEEFSERGYSATTVDDIVSRAGATRATFYLHFKGKSELVLELMEKANDFRPHWEVLREFPQRPSRERIRAWLDATTKAWEDNRDLISVIYQGVAADQELLAGQDERARAVLSVFVDSIRHLGWADDSHARIEAMLLFAPLERIFTYWNFEDDTGERGQVLDLLTENWWTAFNRAADTAPAAADAGERRTRRRPAGRS
jgi:AcrR family transcriptional regulator